MCWEARVGAFMFLSHGVVVRMRTAFMCLLSSLAEATFPMLP